MDFKGRRLSPEHQYIGDDRRRRSSGISIADKSEPSITDVKITMIDGDGNSSEECRERIEMRCLAADNTRMWENRREPEVLNPEASGGKRRRRSVSDPPPPLPPSPTEQASPPASYSAIRSTTSPVVSSAEEEGSPHPAISSGSSSSSANPPVAFGLVSLSGRSRVMEDAVSVRPGFYRRQDGSPVDFFAVFDGHGGSHVSALCKERMHVVLSEELTGPSDSSEKDTWRSAVTRGFSRMDELALAACACGRVAPPPCACEWSGFKSDIVGSTAVVAMVASDCILLANCGDSRAVLSRGGQAIPLSDDHKPDRPDELARIEATGGRVIYVNGARVHGILAMSRALGDKYLKPEVISDPEIKIVERTSTDEFLIIASDGLWDVIPNDLACDVARRCLEESDPARDAADLNSRTAESAVAAEEEEQVQESDSKCSLAAALLARLALGRMSADNISVIVVDLRRRM